LADAGHVAGLADEGSATLRWPFFGVVIDDDADADELAFKLLLDLIEFLGLV